MLEMENPLKIFMPLLLERIYYYHATFHTRKYCAKYISRTVVHTYIEILLRNTEFQEISTSNNFYVV